ncbi:taspase, threonine aspartase, 1 [Borealophlyctis nickersoniae]|nr:taspase, threonine aspartase, 1 [Borealophlyctis nickersoniae]
MEKSADSSTSLPTKQSPSSVPFVCVHAGAGYHSKVTEPQLRKVVAHAAAEAIRLLRHPSCSAVDAVEAAVKVLEDSPLTNAGLGSNLNIDGKVECDASIMDGTSRGFGAVGAVSGIKNPICGAVKVLEGDKRGPGLLGRIPPMMLAGEGARRWCAERGAELVDPDALVTDEARKRWNQHMTYLRDAEAAAKEEKKTTGQKERIEEEAESNSDENGLKRPHSNVLQLSANPRKKSRSLSSASLLYDTVGAIVYDGAGNIASGVSSGGISLKYPGRVGEAACFGSGVWAQSANASNGNRSVGCNVSGTGEQIMKTTLARECATLFGALPSADRSPDESDDTDEVSGENVFDELEELLRRNFLNSYLLSNYDEKNAGLVLARVEGDMREIYVAHTTDSMCFGYMCAQSKGPHTKVSRRRDGEDIVIEGIMLGRPKSIYK